MNIVRQIPVVVLALVLLIGGQAANAQNANPQGGQGHKFGTHRQQMIQKLNLTEAQQAQMKTLKDSFHEHNKGAIDEMKAKFQQLRALKQSGSADQAQIDALKTEIKAQREALKPQRQAFRDQMSSILTPEQREKLKTLKPQGQKHHQWQNKTAPSGNARQSFGWTS